MDYDPYIAADVVIRPGDGDLHGNTFSLRNWSVFFASEVTAPVPTAGSAFAGLQPQAEAASTGAASDEAMQAVGTNVAS